MILSNYRTMVQNEVGDASSRAQNVIDRAIKDVYQEILVHASRYLVGNTEEDVTASTSNRYITPTNEYSSLKHVLWHSATDTDFKELTPITEDEYYATYVNSDTDEPTRYYLKENKIYFERVPSSAGTFRIVGIVITPELEGSVVSVIPDRFTNVLITGAIGRFKSYEGTADAVEYLKAYKGSFWGQGRIDGLLGNMLMELSTKKTITKPKLFGR